MLCPVSIFCILPFSFFFVGCTHRCDDDRTTAVADCGGRPGVPACTVNNSKSANNADPRQTGDAVMAGVVAVGGTVLALV
ncbi:hypothetical protein PG997_003367 [Apiospora hydei]|uniref:Uncharacterized protein n=1 Tax=Apiospora hydei TaxID=1337664 RepID=A0ABR1WZ19_9PEZI